MRNINLVKRYGNYGTIRCIVVMLKFESIMERTISNRSPKWWVVNLLTIMQYIAFDFETSGLPTGRDNYDTCRAVSLSAARFSSRGRLTGTFDTIIQPTDFIISQGSIDVHGITQERAHKEGRPFTVIFSEFLAFIGPRTKTIVAHNAKFDTAVLRSEMLRHGLSLNLLDTFDFQCTMELYRARYLKPIKLGVLYEDLFGYPFENAHNSLADCIACGQVYPFLIGPRKNLKPIGIPTVCIPISDIGYGFKKPIEYIHELKKRQPLPLNETVKRILETFRSRENINSAQNLRAVYHQLEHSQLEPKDIIAAKNALRLDGSITYPICELEGTVYTLVAYPPMDTLIKKRSNGLVGRIRPHELIECQAHLHIFGRRYCHFTEQFDGEHRTYLVERNTEKWNEDIIPKLKTFCTFFHEHLS